VYIIFGIATIWEITLGEGGRGIDLLNKETAIIYLHFNFGKKCINPPNPVSFADPFRMRQGGLSFVVKGGTLNENLSSCLQEKIVFHSHILA
jgi:hypothetical protein